MDEKLALPSEQEQAQRSETESVTRRTFLMNVGIALNAAVALVIATPVVAYRAGACTAAQGVSAVDRDWRRE